MIVMENCKVGIREDSNGFLVGIRVLDNKFHLIRWSSICEATLEEKD